MKTFRDLYLRLNGVSIEEVTEKLTLHCHPPWLRCYDNEDGLELSGKKPYCFEREETAGAPSAALFLFEKDDDVWYVSNIVPASVSELSYDEYNEILEDFLESLVKPSIEGTVAEAEITSNEVSVRSVAGREVEAALVRFSKLANKSAGSSHPLDRQRWFEFLVLANQAHSNLNADLIIRALIELGWSEERAYELGLQFEFANDLLSYFQER